MGLYLNPGNDSFRIAINGNIYVDKTGMISFLNQHLNTESRYVCVSRPRRFGKSMAAGMLAAYYSRGCASEKLFEGYRIAEDTSFREHLNQYDVIYLNIQQFLRKTESYAKLGECIEEAVLEELEELYPDDQNKSRNLPDILSMIYSRNAGEKKGFIFIIDEWDCIFRVAKNDADAQEKYLDFLRDLFKDRVYVALAYMTGILPIKKYGTHSAINIFDEYSMMNPQELAEFVGFTEEEVRALCVRYEMDFERVQSWYDGYQFNNKWNIYNPKSVVDAMRKRELDSYWTQTETYEALKIYMEMDFDGLKTAIVTMLGGGRYKINSRRFQNDMTSFRTKDDVLTLLVHLGYLAYDRKYQEVYIPNQEVASEFMNALDEPEWKGVIETIAQ